ncbi:hypothetical protein [Candidatus Bealeia paramacronuclearis]
MIAKALLQVNLRFFNLIYCAIQKITEKCIAPLQNWALTISQLDVYFEARLQLGSMFNR